MAEKNAKKVSRKQSRKRSRILIHVEKDCKIDYCSLQYYNIYCCVISIRWVYLISECHHALAYYILDCVESSTPGDVVIYVSLRTHAFNENFALDFNIFLLWRRDEDCCD